MASGSADVGPDHVSATVCRAIRRLVSEIGPETSKKIAALGISTIFGYVFLDTNDRPVGGATTWLDARATVEAAALGELLSPDAGGTSDAGVTSGVTTQAAGPGAGAGTGVHNHRLLRLIEITGRRPSAEWLAPLLLWHRYHQPDRLEKTVSIVGLKDEMVRRLTGVLGTDFAHQDYSMLYDISRGEPSMEIAEALAEDGTRARSAGHAHSRPRPPEKLIREATPAQAPAGPLQAVVATDLGLPSGIPVCRGSSDGTAAMYGAGVLRSAGTALVAGTTDVAMRYIESVGSGAFGAGNGAPAESLAGSGLNVNRGMEGGFLVGGATASSSRAVELVCGWLGIKPHEAFKALEEQLASEAGSNRPARPAPLCFPGFFGERAPYWDDHLAGSIVGLRPDHRPVDILRGVIEGTGHRIGVLLRDLGAGDCVSVTGGGALAAWNQLRADTLGVPVKELAQPEATTIGTAMFCRSMIEDTPLLALTPGLFEKAVDYQPRHREYHVQRRKQFASLIAVSRLED